MKLFPEATHMFTTNPTSGLRTAPSRVSYRKTLGSLQNAYPDFHLSDFTEKDLVNWLSRPNLSPATVACYRTRIHGFFSWALWQEMIQVDPSANLSRLVKGSFTRPVRENHWLSTEDVGMVLDSIDTSTTMGLRDMIIARLGFTLGLRRAEIAGLTWDQIDLERQQVTVKGKGGRLSTLFLTDGSLPFFETWYDSATEHLGPMDGPVIPALVVTSIPPYDLVPNWRKPVSPDAVSKRVLSISAASVRFAPHDMRRSYANLLVEGGYTVEEISVALRHSDLGTTQRYLEYRQDAAFQAVKERGLTV